MAEGYKDWAAGDILTAADLEDYTVKQSVMRFADASARTTALSGVLAEGMVSYLKDTDSVEVYDGSAWAAVGGGGSVLVSRTTIGSAVSSVTVSNAFSADYDNYRIVIRGGAATVALSSIYFTLGGTATGYYWAYIYGVWLGASPALARGANSSEWLLYGSDTNGYSVDLDIFGPYLADETSFHGSSTQMSTNTSTARTGHLTGFLNNTTSYTDFTLTISSGTITGGTVDVYGYAKA